MSQTKRDMANDEIASPGSTTPLLIADGPFNVIPLRSW